MRYSSSESTPRPTKWVTSTGIVVFLLISFRSSCCIIRLQELIVIVKSTSPTNLLSLAQSLHRAHSIRSGYICCTVWAPSFNLRSVHQSPWVTPYHLKLDLVEPVYLPSDNHQTANYPPPDIRWRWTSWNVLQLMMGRGDGSSCRAQSSRPA